MLDVSSYTLLCSNLIFHLSFLNFNFIPFMCLQKLSLEEDVDMLISIYLKQSITFGSNNLITRVLASLFAMFDDYVRTFKQSSLYYDFLQGGASRIGLDKNEVHLHMANQYRDLIQIIVTIAKYTSSFNLSTRISHLEGEVFGSAKHKADLPLGSKQIRINMIE